MRPQPSDRRNKLGLALAGGGFRASLFHLGVLRRMAELDLLRYVEVMSTVSGGSIIGALYALLLKKHLEKPENNGQLSRDQYVQIMDELQAALVSGIQKNLRTLLFVNPLGILRVLTTPQSLGKRMARLYERYLYKDVVEEIEPKGWWQRTFRPGRIKLENIRINPRGQEITSGIEGYNQDQVNKALAQKPDHTDKAGPAATTKLVLNATSLNSGARFFFTSSEIGDWFLGYFRHDREEIDNLKSRKALLEDISLEELREHVNSKTNNVAIGRYTYPLSDLTLALWWREREKAKTAGPENRSPAIDPACGWELLLNPVNVFRGLIPDAEFGRLRLAKIHAWYVRYGLKMQVSGGVNAEEHMGYFWDHLEGIDPNQTDQLRKLSKDDPRIKDTLMDFILGLYLLRSAATMSPRIERDWEKLSLGEGVGASACFPPVFPPLQVLGFYDDVHVSRLGLTDGGVYDNIGWNALLDEECNHIIASDTGGLLGIRERVSAGRLSMIPRITSILMAAVAWNQSDRMREKHGFSKQIGAHLSTSGTADLQSSKLLAGHGLNSLTYFHIDSPPAEIPSNGPPRLKTQLDRTALASIRTDLDGFGNVEIAALVNHGYLTADSYIRREFCKETPYYNETFWKVPPTLPYALKPDDRVTRIIKVGSSRLGRALKLGAPLTWSVTILAFAIICYVVLRNRKTQVSVHDVLSWLAGKAVGLVESSISLFGSAWTQRPFSIGTLFLSIFLVVLAWICVRWILGFNLVEWLQRKGALRWARRAGWIAKWIRGSSGNLLWPFGGAPLTIALISFVSSSISHIFFYLPFKAKTKNIES